MKIFRTHAVDLMRRPTGATPRVRPAIEVQQRPGEPDPDPAEAEEDEAQSEDARPSLETTAEELSVDASLGDVHNPDARPSRVSGVYDELQGDDSDQALDVVF